MKKYTSGTVSRRFANSVPFALCACKINKFEKKDGKSHRMIPCIYQRTCLEKRWRTPIHAVGGQAAVENGTVCFEAVHYRSWLSF